MKLVEIKPGTSLQDVPTKPSNVVSINPWAVTLITAIIAVLPALITSLVDLAVKPQVQRSETRLSNAKLELERRKNEMGLYQLALADTDSTSRYKSVRLLVKAGFLKDVGLTPGELPHWPTPTKP